jgi:hypothetical protein
MGTTIKYLQRASSGAAGNGLGTTIKYAFFANKRNSTAEARA